LLLVVVVALPQTQVGEAVPVVVGLDGKITSRLFRVKVTL
jgi:hypothetical protein